MKNIIITGRSSGFGLKAAADFPDKGYKVFAPPCATRGGKTLATRQNAKVILHCHRRKVSMSWIDDAGIMFLGITEAFSVDQAHERMNANLLQRHSDYAGGSAC
jgi:NAD(P)-dependent dehydrogenase (short-subunit alcohol dehydrogenase family)